MLSEIAVAVFTLDPTLYEKVEGGVRGLADRIAQFSFHDRVESLERFAADSNLIVFLETGKQREACLRWIQRVSEFGPNSYAVCLEEDFDQEHSLRATRAGATDLLVGKFTAEDVASLTRRLANTFDRYQFPSPVPPVPDPADGCPSRSARAGHEQSNSDRETDAQRA